MKLDEITASLKDLDIIQLKKLRQTLNVIITYKNNIATNEMMMVLKVTDQVEVHRNGAVDFIGTVMNIKRTNVVVKDNNSGTRWNCPAYMLKKL